VSHVDDLSRSLAAFGQGSTLVAVVEMSQSSWLAGGVVPGLERRPLKKLEPDPMALLRLLENWRDRARTAGQTVHRIVLAFEAGRDGFWLARWLRARGVKAYVIHPTSVAVSREHRRDLVAWIRYVTENKDEFKIRQFPQVPDFTRFLAYPCNKVGSVGNSV
jgi:transposase